MSFLPTALYVYWPFYRAILRNAERDAASRPFVTLRYRVSWSHRLEFLQNNFMADQPWMFTLCRPQNHGDLLQREHPKSLTVIGVW